MTALRHPAVRAALVFVAVVAVFNGVGLVLGRGEPGPPSSSYSTGPNGVAAFAELLARNDFELERLRVPLGETPLDPGDTLVLLDALPPPGGAQDDLERFVRAGGRLVTGGFGSEWLEGVIDPAPQRASGGATTLRPLVPSAVTSSIDEVSASGEGSFSEAGAALAVLGDDDGAAVVVAPVDEGEIVLLADVSVVHNAHLDRADNARLALNLAGDLGRVVIFIESVHGYSSTGIAAIPERWKWTLAGLMLAVVVFMWARGRRLGPPEASARALAPARLAYVESLAGILLRTRNPGESMVSLQERLRSRLDKRAGPRGSMSDDELKEAGGDLGLEPGDLDVLFGVASSESDVLALGRVAHVLVGAGAGRHGNGRDAGAPQGGPEGGNG